MDPPPAGTPEQWMRVAEKLLVLKDLEGCREFCSQALAADSRTPGAEDLHAAAAVLLAAQRRRMPNGQPEPYAVLCLEPANPASRHPGVVHSSYRRLSLLLNRHPPDRPTSASFAEASLLVADAWAFLSNPGLKSALDTQLDAAAPAPAQLLQPQPSPRPQQRATGAAPQPRPSPQQSPAAPQPPQPSPPRAAAPPPLPRQSPISVWAAPQLRPPTQQSPVSVWAAPQLRPPPHHSPIPAAPEPRPPPQQSPIQAAPQPPRQSPIPAAPQPRPPPQQSPVPAYPQPPLPQQPSPLPADPQPRAGAAAQPVESGTQPPSPTFWTTCRGCSHIHQYDRLYEARKLKCSSCHQPFVAEAMTEAPPIVPGTDMYYCTWGFFPIGFPGCPGFESLVNKKPQGPDQLNAPWLGANGVVDANGGGVEDNGGAADVQNGTPVSASVELPEVLEPEPLMRMRVQVPAVPEPVMPTRVQVPAVPKPAKTMTVNSVNLGGKKRGRPKGSKNKKGTKNMKNF